MPFTTAKGYSVQAAGSNPGVWGAGNTGVDLNTGVIEYIDQNMGGVTSVTTFGGLTNLTATQCRNAMIRVSGTLGSSATINSNGNLMTGFYFFDTSALARSSTSYSLTFTSTINSITLPWARNCVVWSDATSNPSVVAICGSSTAAIDAVPFGTQMLFLQANVPTGWSAVGGFLDYGIRIVGAGSGLVQTGASLYSTVFGQTSTGSTVLTVAQMPSHQHNYQVATFTSIAASGSATVAVNTATSQTEPTGGGLGHEHSMDMRVLTVGVVAGTKN